MSIPRGLSSAARTASSVTSWKAARSTLLVADRVPFGEPVQHLPGDRLALPVRVGGEDQPLGILQRPGDRAERPGGRLAGLVDHRKPVPGIDRARLRRQVANMAAGRHHPV